MKAEYVASFEATGHGVWKQNFIGDLETVDSIDRLTRMYCDNSIAVSFSNNLKDRKVRDTSM